MPDPMRKIKEKLAFLNKAHHEEEDGDWGGGYNRKSKKKNKVSRKRNYKGMNQHPITRKKINSHL